MYCANCGSLIADNQRYCGNCGQLVINANQGGSLSPIQDQPKTFQPTQPAFNPQMGYGQTMQSNLVGFSTRINDPAFKKYQKSATNYSFLFAFILAVIACIGFPVFGKLSGEIDWPESLYYGFGIGGMFIVIALLQTLKKGVEKTWDGVVVDKNVRKYCDNRDDSTTQWHMAYIVKIKKDNRGTKIDKWIDQPGLYNYYNVGDHIRHHKGFYYYEKYDKSQDAQIMCAACMAFADIRQNQCERCKCPLLK